MHIIGLPGDPKPQNHQKRTDIDLNTTTNGLAAPQEENVSYFIHFTSNINLLLIIIEVRN